MPVDELPDAADSRHCILVADVAAQGVARVSRVDDHSAVTHDCNRPLNQTWLWISGVDLKVLRH